MAVRLYAQLIHLCAGILFHLRVYHPYRPLLGLIDAFRVSIPCLMRAPAIRQFIDIVLCCCTQEQAKAVDSASISQMHSAARTLIAHALLTGNTLVLYARVKGAGTDSNLGVSFTSWQTRPFSSLRHRSPLRFSEG